MYVNLDKGRPRTVVLHIEVSDILHNDSQSIIDSFIANIKKMVEKCRNTTVGKIFVPGLVCSTNIDLPVLERTRTTLVSLCNSNNCLYVKNNNIRGIHLFKDGIRLLESSKVILANNFVFYLNRFLYAHTYPNSVNICSESLRTNTGSEPLISTTSSGS